jgi:hypothetical protein
MRVRQSQRSDLLRALSPIKTIKSARPVDLNQESTQWWNRIDQRPLNLLKSADLSRMISRLYRPAAVSYRASAPPAAALPGIARWLNRLYSALPRRPGINWEQFEQELYAPAVQAVQMEMRKALPELENRDIYSGIEGSSSWTQRAKARAFSDAARIIGELRSQAGARRKEAEIRQRSQERSEALGLLRLASEMASREASAKDAARMGAWRIGEQARIQDLLKKGAAASDFLRSLLSNALKSADAGAVARLVNSTRLALR